MAYKPEIQYIEQFFIPGSEAPQLQPKRGGKSAWRPQTQQEKKIKIMIDPVALFGLVVAVTMLVLMAVICALMFWLAAALIQPTPLEEPPAIVTEESP
jgi:hypothetical protein